MRERVAPAQDLIGIPTKKLAGFGRSNTLRNCKLLDVTKINGTGPMSLSPDDYLGSAKANSAEPAGITTCCL